MILKRRLDEVVGRTCDFAGDCPSVWELDNGDIIIVGKNVTNEIRAQLPLNSGVGPDEEVVLIPRSVFVSTKADIVNE